MCSCPLRVQPTFQSGATPSPTTHLRCAALLLVVSVLSLIPVAFACAESWPTRPILMTVIGTPGSTPDVIARELGERVGRALGQPIIIENQGASGGIVGMDQVRRAPADGYRFAFSHLTAIVVNPALFKSLPYDPVRDFEPVSLLVSGPFILVVTPKLGVVSVDQLVQLTRTKPGTLFYGSTGIATPSNIFFEQFKSATRISIDGVPFKGPPGLMLALQTDEVPLGMEGYQALLPLLSSGKVRPLAVTGDTRMAVLPDVPTFKELGIPGIGVSWMAVLAPKGTPPAIITSMQRELARAVTSPDLRHAYEALGRQVIASSPDELAARIRSELPHWREVIRRTGVKIE